MTIAEKPQQDFWSRRRAAVADEENAEALAFDADQQAAEQAVLDQKTDAEILTELNLPDPDTLKQGDDFTGFLAKAVPERIRRRALRKLWLSNPVLANLDALVDYGEDFTDAATVVENLQTAYQVGKGMLTHILEQERLRELSEAAEDEADAEAEGTSPPPAMEDAPKDETAPPSDVIAAQTPTQTPTQPDPMPVTAPAFVPTTPRRRMRVAYET